MTTTFDIDSVAVRGFHCLYRQAYISNPPRRWRKSDSRIPPQFATAISRRRRITLNSRISGSRRSGSSTTSLSTTSDVLISRQRFIFFLIFTIVVSLNGSFLSPSVCFSLQLPVFPLSLKVLSALHFFLLRDAIVDHRAGEDDESSHYYFGRWPLVKSETGGGVMSRSAGRDGCYSQDVWQNVVDDLRLLCGRKWRKVYFQDR